MKHIFSTNVLASLLFFAGSALVINASYIQLKAELAQLLIASAYSQQVATNKLHKPWPWADTAVLAKLEIGDNIDYVLADASMRTLAFGPAHMSHTSPLGEFGNSVIVGHRDTHFSHLQHIKIGQLIHLQLPGNATAYQVEEISIVEATQVGVMDELPINALTLITCYPFNDINPNPNQRFVVRAIKVI